MKETKPFCHQSPGASLVHLLMESSKQRRSQGRSYLSKFWGSNSGSCLIFFPGGGGNILRFRHLVNLLTAHSLVAVIPRGWGEGEAPHRSFARMTEEYRKEITPFLSQYQKVHFIGWCFGGLTAFECGHHLSQEEKWQGKLIMLDTVAPFSTGKRGPDAKKARLFPDIQSICSDLWERARALSVYEGVPFEEREGKILALDAFMERRYRTSGSSLPLELIWSSRDTCADEREKEMHQYFDLSPSVDGWRQIVGKENVRLGCITAKDRTIFDPPNVNELANYVLNSLG